MSEMTVKLGKHPYRHDDRTLKLSRYLVAEELEPVGSLDLDTIVSIWPMDGNDRIGDCGPVGAAHLMQGWQAAVAHAMAKPEPSPLPEQDVIAFYSAISGYDPQSGANDNGVVLLDLLNKWRTVGLGGHKIGAFVAVDVKRPDGSIDWQVYDWASVAFGGLLLGFALPVAIQPRGERFPDWQSVGVGPQWAPGSWGGHCVNETRNNRRGGMGLASWERKLAASRPFHARYRDEAWAILSTDWLDDHGKAPSGLNMRQLSADLQRVT